jgi:Mannosyltransferase putative
MLPAVKPNCFIRRRTQLAVPVSISNTQEHNGKNKRTKWRITAFVALQRFLMVGACAWLLKIAVLPISPGDRPCNPSLQYPKPRTFIDQDVPELQYSIDLRLVPTAQISMTARDFSNERICIKENDNTRRESTIGIEAFREYGEEIRLLLRMGRETLLSAGKQVQSTLAFRKRLHARAPWLRGNPQSDPNWPLSTLPTPVEGGKAILICAGDRQLAYLKTLVHSIRVIHNSPIAIRIVFRDNNDLKEESQQAVLDGLPKNLPANIQFINLSKLFDLDASSLKAGWNLKPFGLLAVPETQVVTLDVDVMLLQSPETLFHMEGYVDKGALFFHDRMFLNLKGFYDPGALAKLLQPSLSATATSVIHYGKAESYMAEHIMESGMVLLDKQRRMLGIWAVCLIMGRNDIRQYAQGYYIYGDKELYWIGMEIVSEPYTFARYFPGAYGSILTNFHGTDVAVYPKDDEITTAKQMEQAQADRRYGLCGRIVHFDDMGQPLWSNGGYFTKEEDWHSSSQLAEQPLYPVWYADGGIWTEEEFIPNVDDGFASSRWFLSWLFAPHNPNRETLQRAQQEWGAAFKKGNPNQFWKTHGGMGVMCLLPNARGIRALPKDLSMTALRAVKRFFVDELKKIEYVALWN